MLGKFSRDKGKRFERKIATAFRECFPKLAEEIRRSIQSRQAEESDVTGFPRLWIECQHAAEPTPRKKLDQAIGDLKAINDEETVPVAITHKTRTKGIFAHMLLKDLMRISDIEDSVPEYLNDLMVTISFEELLEITKRSTWWEDYV